MPVAVFGCMAAVTGMFASFLYDGRWLACRWIVVLQVWAIVGCFVMRRPGCALCALAFLGVTLWVAGQRGHLSCSSSYRPKTVVFLVVEEGTFAPISGAEVRISYASDFGDCPLYGFGCRNIAPCGVTGRDGIAVLRVAFLRVNYDCDFYNYMVGMVRNPVIVIDSPFLVTVCVKGCPTVQFRLCDVIGEAVADRGSELLTARPVLVKVAGPSKQRVVLGRL